MNELELRNIEVGGKIGKGAFGEVLYGNWQGTPVTLHFLKEEIE